MKKRINICCATCGSDNVYRDAWASWNVELQLWELGNVFDAGFCAACDGEASLKEVAMEKSDEKAR